MKKTIFSVLLASGAGLGLILLWILAGSSYQAAAAPMNSLGRAAGSVITVCTGGSCDYTSIQAAVDAAVEGDLIKVGQGLYTDLSIRPRKDISTTGVVTQVVYIDKSVTLQGGYPPGDWNSPDPKNNLTILDAGGHGRGLYISGEISPVIKGLTITGGDAIGMGGSPDGDAGGGVYVYMASASLQDNLVHINKALHGGGIYLDSSASSLIDNVIEANQAVLGGGISLLDCDEAVVSGNLIEENEGSGIRLRDSDAHLSHNVILSNTATNGGGVNINLSAARLSNNTIAGNQAFNNGGGLFFFSYGEQPELSGNLILSNTANYLGGGVQLDYMTDARMTNNVIAGNQAPQGSAMNIQSSSPRLVHNTIARNLGGEGLTISRSHWAPSVVVMTNTIMVSHTVGISVTGANTVTVSGVLWESTPVHVSQSPTATVTLQGEHLGSPAFALDGYHLTDLSDARDQGLVTGFSKDIDGEPRPYGGYDLGADEFWPPGTLKRVYLPLLSN
jgi:parallel beta-helix repeat protein